MKTVAILVLALCAVACLGRSWESEYALNPPPPAAAAPPPPPAAPQQEAKPQEGPAQNAAAPAPAQEGKEAVCTGDSCNPAPSPALQSLSKAFDQLKIPAAGDIPDQDFDKLLYCIGANYEQQHASQKKQQQQQQQEAKAPANGAKQQEAPKKQQEGGKKKQQQEAGKKKKQQQEAKAPANGAPAAPAAAAPPAQAPAFIAMDEPQPLAQNAVPAAPAKQEAPAAAAVPPPPPSPAAAANGKPQQEAAAPAPAQAGKQQQEAPKQAQQEAAIKADAGGSGIALAHLRKLISTVCCLDSPDDANPKCTKDELVACVKVGIAKVLTKEAAGINYVKHNGNKKAVEVPSKAVEQMATPANAGAPVAAPAGGKKQQESNKKKQQEAAPAAKPAANFLETEDSIANPPPPAPAAANAAVPPEKAQVLAKLGKQVAGTFKQGQALAHNDVQNAKAAPPAVQNFILKEANSQKVEDDLHLFRKTLKAGIDCANIDFSKLNAKTYLFGPQKPKKQQQEAANGKPAAPQEAAPKKQQEAGPKKQQEAAPKKQQQEAPAPAAAPAPPAAPAF